MLISASKSEKYYQKCIFFVAILCPSKKCCTFAPRLRENVTNAAIAQLVERNLAKVEVAGPNPVCRSIKTLNLFFRTNLSVLLLVKPYLLCK